MYFCDKLNFICVWFFVMFKFKFRINRSFFLLFCRLCDYIVIYIYIISDCFYIYFLKDSSGFFGVYYIFQFDVVLLN